MAHNDNCILAGNDLSKSMGFNSRLNSCALLHLLTLTTEVRDIVIALDNSLISASSKSKVDSVSIATDEDYVKPMMQLFKKREARR